MQTAWPTLFGRPDFCGLWPQTITLPHKEGAPEYTRPGQFAARLGLEYDPVFVDGSREKPLEFSVPALKLEGDVTLDRLSSRRELLSALDEATRLCSSAVNWKM